MKEKNLLLSIRDPLLLDPKTSPLLVPENELQGFVPVNFWTSMEFGRKSTEKAYHEDPLFKKVKHNFERLRKSSSNYFEPPRSFDIPPKIHFIWLGSPLPKEFQAAFLTWKKCHPGWEIHLWTEEKLPSFEWSNGYTKWLFGDAKTWGEKSDILRYEILYQFGGIYSDLDAICYKSFNDIISSSFTFFACQETNRLDDSEGEVVYVSNAIFGAAAHHPILKYCLDHLISQDEALNVPLMRRTGPFLLSKAISEELKKKEGDKTLVLPCSYLYPLPHFKNLMHKALTGKEIKENYLAKESLILHLFAASWYL